MAPTTLNKTSDRAGKSAWPGATIIKFLDSAFSAARRSL
jgi:hypothetical protein